jgi:hypothetical protein
MTRFEMRTFVTVLAMVAACSTTTGNGDDDDGTTIDATVVQLPDAAVATPDAPVATPDAMLSAPDAAAGVDAAVGVDAAAGVVAAAEPDAAAGVDAAAGPDAAASVCLADASYGAATLSNQIAQSDAGTSQLLYGGFLNADATPDAVQIELYAGFGAFTSAPIQPGTYPLTGAELNYATCGVCVRLLTDISMGSASDAGYLATGGTLTITSVTPNITGTLSNLTFQHVNIAPSPSFMSTPHPDLCTSAITSAAFDVVVTII